MLNACEMENDVRRETKPACLRARRLLPSPPLPDPLLAGSLPPGPLLPGPLLPGPLLPGPRGASDQQQIEQGDQRCAHAGGNQRVIGAEVGLGFQHGLAGARGHAGTLRPDFPGVCEPVHRPPVWPEENLNRSGTELSSLGGCVRPSNIFASTIGRGRDRAQHSYVPSLRVRQSDYSEATFNDGHLCAGTSVRFHSLSDPLKRRRPPVLSPVSGR